MISVKEMDIMWNDYVKLSVPQQQYILSEIKNLKSINWSNIL